MAVSLHESTSPAVRIMWVPAVSPSMHEPGSPKPSVLVVADRTALLRGLQCKDRRLLAEPSAEAGLRRLASEEADAVVSEDRLPGIDGLGFLRAVRAEYPRLPFVLAPTDGSEVLASKAISAGVTEYVPRDGGDGRGQETLAHRVEAVLDAEDAGTARTAGTRGEASTAGAVTDALRLKERAMDAAPVGITVSDATAPDYPLIYVNDAFERITGYAREAVLGHNCRFLQGERSDPAAIAAMREAIGEDRPVSVELLNYRKDGTPFWNEVDIAPLRDDEGEVTHYVGFQADVTDRKRTEREAERKAESLARERASLDRLLDRIEGLLQETTGALLRADTREAAERALVEGIAAAAPYVLAWVGDPAPTGETLTLEARAEAGAGDLATALPEPGAALDVGADSFEGSALATAIEERRTGTETDPVLPTTARTRAAGSGGQPSADRGGSVDPDGVLGNRDGGGDDGGSDHGTQTPAAFETSDAVGTGAAIPIADRNTLYGVLSVYTEAGRGIDERELAVLEALCNAAATTIDALESKRVLTAEDVLELTFEIREEDLFFAAISARGKCTLEYAGSAHGPGSSLCVFVTVSGAPADRIGDLARECREVRAANPITERENDCLFEFELAEPSIASVLADQGAMIRDITAEDGICRLCVTLPRERDARSVADALEDRYGSADLVEYHERERPARTESDFLDAVEKRLTDRQLTALRLAHVSGFFEKPRPVAGEELAASMGISRSTFHQHLRAAERKLAAVFFER
jgi:PAS domain S-box-containing protein